MIRFKKPIKITVPNLPATFVTVIFTDVYKRQERHRHRYEVNNDFRAALTEGGMKLCGTSPDGRIVEMIEIPDQDVYKRQVI